MCKQNQIIEITLYGFSEVKAAASGTQKSERFKHENWSGKLGLWIKNAFLMEINSQEKERPLLMLPQEKKFPNLHQC